MFPLQPEFQPSFFPLHRSLVVLFCAGIALLAWGGVTGRGAPATSPATELSRLAVASPAGGARQWWDIHYLRDPKKGARRPAGYRRSEQRRVAEGDGMRRRCEVDEVLRFKRFGNPTEISLRAWNVETPAGTPVRFAYQIDMRPGVQRVEGETVAGRVHYRLVSGERTRSATRDCPAGARGFLGVEQSLRTRPMRPGERRTVVCLQPVPVFGDLAMAPLFAPVHLAAERHEDIPLPGGTRHLLRIRSRTVLAAAGTIRATLWTDAHGEILRVVAEALGQETLRTTRRMALQQDPAAALDLGQDILIPVARSLPDAHATQRIEYRVTLADGDPTTVFASCLSQQVRRLSAHTARVIVRRVRPDQPSEVPAGTGRSGPRDLAANAMVQSDDPQVVAMATAAAAGQTDPWTVAVALEAYVHNNVVTTDFSQVFASAAQVARTRRGDCTEHAVLLAALCRARHIPARVAFGLVYVAPQHGFLYHMWDEVWISDRWIPIDGTLGRGGIGAAHLKFADSNLAGASAYTGLLPISNVVGRLRIDVVDVK